MTESEFSYLAGFIDGEGALLINKREHINHKKGTRYMEYSAYLDIGNTNLEVIQWIHNKLNVTSKIYTNQMSGNRKLAYRLRICYKQARPLIERIKPMLIVKREIADVFLQYNTTADKEPLFQQAKILNKRGIL